MPKERLRLKPVREVEHRLMVVSEETGEVLSDQLLDMKVDNILVGDKGAFFLTYFSFLSVFEHITLPEVKLLTFMATHSTWNSNVFNYNSYVRKEICEKMHIHPQTVKVALAGLVEKKMLVHISKGSYRINPRYYWKGSDTERKNTLKYMFQMECPDC